VATVQIADGVRRIPLAPADRSVHAVLLAQGRRS
jgi:hypothetical protein